MTQNEVHIYVYNDYFLKFPIFSLIKFIPLRKISIFQNFSVFKNFNLTCSSINNDKMPLVAKKSIIFSIFAYFLGFAHNKITYTFLVANTCYIQLP